MPFGKGFSPADNKFWKDARINKSKASLVAWSTNNLSGYSREYTPERTISLVSFINPFNVFGIIPKIKQWLKPSFKIDDNAVEQLQSDSLLSQTFRLEASSCSSRQDQAIRSVAADLFKKFKLFIFKWDNQRQLSISLMLMFCAITSAWDPEIWTYIQLNCPKIPVFAQRLFDSIWTGPLSSNSIITSVEFDEDLVKLLSSPAASIFSPSKEEIALFFNYLASNKYVGIVPHSVRPFFSQTISITGHTTEENKVYSHPLVDTQAPQYEDNIVLSFLFNIKLGFFSGSNVQLIGFASRLVPNIDLILPSYIQVILSWDMETTRNRSNVRPNSNYPRSNRKTGRWTTNNVPKSRNTQSPSSAPSTQGTAPSVTNDGQLWLGDFLVGLVK